MTNNNTQGISAKEELSGLRSEILESQKARIDLLKFKLIAIAALGSVGLGLGEYSKKTGNIDIILCIIPFVCIYIDFLCYHNTMRILVIGQFLAYSDDAYEQYLPKLGENNGENSKSGYYFELEDFSLEWSSFVLSVFIAIYGVYISDSNILGSSDNILNFQKTCFIAAIIISSASIFYLKSKNSKYKDVLFSFNIRILRLTKMIKYQKSSKSMKEKLLLGRRKYQNLSRQMLIIYLALIFFIICISFCFFFKLNKNFIFFLIGEISTICVLLSAHFYNKRKDNLFNTAKAVIK